MKRTLMQLGIGALEEMFATSKTDAKVLKQLENELQHRQVPRAVVLLDQVQWAMKRVPSSVLPTGQDELPLELPAAPAAVPIQPRPAPVRGAPAVVATVSVSQPPPLRASQQASPSAPRPIPQHQVLVEHEPMPVVSLDEACKLLKVTLASSWQEVELSRRKLVLLSHPQHLEGMTPERQEVARVEARRVNSAYAVLSAARAK